MLPSLTGPGKGRSARHWAPHVIKMLPEPILNDCEMRLHPDDAPHWTVAQLKAFRRTQSRHLYDWAQLPPDRIVHFERGQLLLAKAWSAQQLSPAQPRVPVEPAPCRRGWVQAARPRCHCEGRVPFQFRGDASAWPIPLFQAYILANYRGDALPDDLLMNVTQTRLHAGPTEYLAWTSCNPARTSDCSERIGESSPRHAERTSIRSTTSSHQHWPISLTLNCANMVYR